MSPRVRILAEPLSVDRCIGLVKHDGAGAVVVMIGCVRNHTVHQQASVSVARLQYEAYADMAHKVIDAIAADLSTRFPDVRMAVEHRIGDLDIGDLAVVVAASAPHRREAFVACSEAIERLKQDAPIWKREHGSDGVVWVGTGP
jgi:molybdopterin synthase catalytic subunit